ncbi:hypothetical protein R1flu_028045 [Riccia fluitans]|uniref:Nucleolar protein 14 n=1 Tax=Riccia fluitans TaxID=41844 RepID=A0ABD1XKJ4_9MARC
MAKKRKISTPTAVAKKSKKKLKGGIEKIARGKPQKEASANLFETIWSRRKFDVLGKKQKKGETRRVGLSRSLAVEKRKDTLLQEYKERNKGNKFVDRRFGEKDAVLNEEEKAIMRFQKERQAQISRQSKFALRDEDEEEEEILTHGGKALSTVDDYEDEDNDSMEDDDDFLDGLSKEEVMNLHFGGGKDGGNDRLDGQKPKTKKEIMEELIAKSKYYKAQKAKEKEEDQDLQEKLNKDFTELVQSQALSSLFRPTRKDNLKAMLTGSSAKDKTSNKEKDEEEEKPDDFDKIMKEMIFDRRGHATDRLKTDEEVLKEERERLEELERKRKQRMLGEDSDEEGPDNNGEDGKENSREKKKKKREISGDDLGENFILDDEENEGRGWVDEVLARKDDEEAESDEEGGSNEDEDEDDEEDEDVEDDDEDLDEEGSEEETREELLEKVRLAIEKKKMEERQEKTAKKAPENREAQDALPFVISAPQTLPELRALVDYRTDDELVVAIQRIRTCNAISLAAENRRKMQIFYNVLLQYFGSLASEKPFRLSRLNLLTKPLIELSMETPYFAATCARERLVHMHTQITNRLKTSDGNSYWPSLRTVLLLRFWSMIFPPSDLRHPVMTPAILFMSEVLCRCPITSGRDVAVGAFMCSLLLSTLREARRFCPEALNFILTLLVSSLPSQTYGKLEFARSICPAFMVEICLGEQWLVLRNKSKKEIEAPVLDFVALMTSEENDPVFATDAYRVGILRTLLQSLNGFISIYEDLMSFPEVFSPVLRVLKRLEEELVIVETLRPLHTQAVEVIETKLAEHERLRQPLRMRVKKRMPIKQFNPKFEENFMKGRNYDPDRERAEKKKLVKRIKSEAKGAARELRKDNFFLMEEKARERQTAEAERKEKLGKAMAFLQEQESAYKSGQLGKGKGRRRR